MNRIREYNNGYQVILTPSYSTNPSNELILGYFLDDKLRRYNIIETRTLQEAQDIAYSYPDIDWNKIVSMHKDVYYEIKQLILKYLNYNKVIAEFKPHILTPQQIKNVMFERVLMNGERFNLFYNFNDTISYDIICTYTQNIINVVNILENVPELNIIKVKRTPSHVKLIGVTKINTPYEIRLWTNNMYNFVYWLYINKRDPRKYMSKLKEINNNQRIIDSQLLDF